MFKLVKSMFVLFFLRNLIEEFSPEGTWRTFAVLKVWLNQSCRVSLFTNSSASFSHEGLFVLPF